MNWIKENKFLFGFLLVMIVGIGVLAFLLLGAKGQYEEALTTYQEKASELSRLQKQPIFPSQKNLDQLLEQKKQATAEAAKLGQALAAQQIPSEEMSPAAFQDKLKAAVNTLKARAAQANPPIKLPEKFFLGFDEYETSPPDPAATVALGRQLKVIDWTIGKLIDSRVVEIKSLAREKLPEELGKPKVEDKKSASAKTDKSGRMTVRKNPFEVVFLADQANFKQILNAIAEYKGQILIPRVIIVKNEKDKGPSRGVGIAFDPNALAAAVPATNPDGTPVDPAAAPAAPPAPAAPVAVPGVPGAAAAPTSNYIVGEERVEVRLVLEAAEFSEAATK